MKKPISIALALLMASSPVFAAKQEVLSASKLQVPKATIEKSITTPSPTPLSAYVLATDKDFDGDVENNFRYIGSADYVIIPETIKGIKLTSYHSLFENTKVKGVLSANAGITDFGYMFAGNTSDTLEFSLDTSDAVNMAGMFMDTKAKELNLKSLDTKNVVYMHHTFANTSAKHLDVSGFNTFNCLDMSSMFEGAQAETIEFGGNYSVYNVENFLFMFKNAKVKKLDLASFNLVNIDYDNLNPLNYMFEGCAATEVYAHSRSEAIKILRSLGRPAGLHVGYQKGYLPEWVDGEITYHPAPEKMPSIYEMYK